MLTRNNTDFKTPINAVMNEVGSDSNGKGKDADIGIVEGCLESVHHDVQHCAIFDVSKWEGNICQF